jgi:hypothetical protein
MRYQKNYIQLPFVLITIAVLFQLFIVGQRVVSLLSLQEKYSNKYPIAWSLIFTIQVKYYLVFTLLALISLLIYYIIRKKFIPVILSKFHVWLVFSGLVVAPVYDSVLSLFSSDELAAHSIQIGNVFIYDYPTITAILLLAVANIFFILTVIKSSTLPKATRPNEFTGFLDEFAQ